MDLDDTLTSRDEINIKMCETLDIADKAVITSTNTLEVKSDECCPDTERSEVTVKLSKAAELE